MSLRRAGMPTSAALAGSHLVENGQHTRMSPQQQNIDDFFRSIDAVALAYQNTTFAYMAIKHQSDFVLVQGRIFFNADPSRVPFSHFQSTSVRAGHYRLAELNMDARALIEC